MWNRIAALMLVCFATTAQAQTATGGVISPQPWGVWIQESGKKTGGQSSYQCPASQVMVGRQHQGDENGNTRYQCATASYDGMPVALGQTQWSDWLQESGKNTGGQSQYVCPPSWLMTGREHKGDENGNTRYQCARVALSSALLVLQAQNWSGPIQESGKNSGGTSSFSCPAQQVMVGRRHQGDENGNTWYLCAVVSWSQSPLVSGAPLQSAWIQESGKNSGGTSSFVCPAGWVMTGRAHQGDENGNTMYWCNQASLPGGPALFNNGPWSDWIQESGKSTGGMSSFACPASQVMIGRQHQGDENGNTRYQCASLVMQGSIAQFTPLDWGPWLQESGKRTGGESVYVCAPDTYMIGRQHKGDENGDTRYQCATATVPFNPGTLASAYRLAATQVGDPATRQPGQFASRASMGLDGGYFLHVDVGGEGYHVVGGVVSGFAGAINVNAQTTDSQPPYAPIPLLIHVESWSTVPPYPFADRSVNYVTLQGAPLQSAAVAEFARILAPGGQVGLWIDMDAFGQNVQQLAQALGSSWYYSCYSGEQPCSNTCVDEFAGLAGSSFSYPKVCIVNRR